MRYHYLLKTLNPVIISESTATQNHQSLDYIPGSAILGMVAAELYPSLHGQSSLTWRLFHSGEVQFSPCYPVIQHENKSSLCLPTPASWHYKKGKEAIKDDRFQAAEITNQATKFDRLDTQYEQCRNGFIDYQGFVAKVEQGITTKTALDASRGGAKDGSLFSYSYIEVGQTFAGYVECENEEQLEQVKKALTGEKYIGRSRSAEFGLVEITQIKPEQKNKAFNITDRVVLWCLSDCELLNAQGLPTFTPALSDLIPSAQGELNKAQSFIRTASVSRYNQARAGLDSEQKLITKGSILVFEKVQNLTQNDLAQIANKGIGINRQQGLGWVQIDPLWSKSSTLAEPLFHPCFYPISEEHRYQEANTPLTQWIKAQMRQAESAPKIEKINQLVRKILEAYEAFRKYNNATKDNLFTAIGPSHTQWGRVRDTIKNHPSNWKAQLFNHHDNKTSSAVCKSVNDEQGWGIEWFENGELTNFAKFCETAFAQYERQELMKVTELLSRYDLSTYKEYKKANEELLGEKA